MKKTCHIWNCLTRKAKQHNQRSTFYNKYFYYKLIGNLPESAFIQHTHLNIVNLHCKEVPNCGGMQNISLKYINLVALLPFQANDFSNVQPVQSLVKVQPVLSLANVQLVQSLANVQPVQSLVKVQPVLSLANVQPVQSLSNVQPVQMLANVQPVQRLANVQPVQRLANV